MKTSLIKKILKQKTDSWLNSIDSESLRDKIKGQFIVTGGAIVSLLTNEKVNDYDIYFKSKEVALIVANYYVSKFNDKMKLRHKDDKEIIINVLDVEGRIKIQVKSAGIASTTSPTNDYQYFENPAVNESECDTYIDDVIKSLDSEVALDNEVKNKYAVKFLTSNAITLSDDMQLIIRFYGSPEEIHKNFDFVHVMGYWDSDSQELILPAKSLESIITKQLYFINSLYPICALIRTRKFIKRGWNISDGEYLKICFKINELDLKDIDVLEDQLTGVDSAYFCELINNIKNSKENIDSIYICKLIDEIF